MEGQVKQLKNDIFKMVWYMRGGVTAEDLFWNYSIEDREIISNIIKENIETVNKTGLPLL